MREDVSRPNKNWVNSLPAKSTTFRPSMVAATLTLGLEREAGRSLWVQGLQLARDTWRGPVSIVFNERIYFPVLSSILMLMASALEYFLSSMTVD